MHSTQTATPQVDGRRARGQANRRKLVAAMIELVREGNVAPTAEQVASRASVALRTVFRHFDDMESLYREIDTEVTQLITPLLHAPFVATEWRGRLRESIARRAELYESILPFRIATDAMRHQSAFLQQRQESIIQMQYSTLMKILPDTVIADAATLAALNLLLSVNAWQQLRMDQGLSREAAHQGMLTAANALTASFAD